MKLLSFYSVGKTQGRLCQVLFAQMCLASILPHCVFFFFFNLFIFIYLWLCWVFISV